MAVNDSFTPFPFVSHESLFLRTSQPFYHASRIQLVPGISDHKLSLASPIIGYWLFSLFFQALDNSNWQRLDKYRIHESVEVTKRNKVTKLQVIRAVIVQHIIQTALGWLFVTGDPETCGGAIAKHLGRMQALVPTLQKLLRFAFGSTFGAYLWNHKADDIVYYTYWWGIPAIQLCFAMFFLDTWQYVFHRAMHVNRFFYKHVHSVHHRLYVPYAFGALYNHPFEGFLLDTLGAVVAENLSGMTARQAAFLFTLSTLKTVDDHCGYKLPFDPFQFLTSNNADYHDIHHQVVGIKSNFSQPFFVHWDVLLGTRLTREDVNTRKLKKTADHEKEL